MSCCSPNYLGSSNNPDVFWVPDGIWLQDRELKQGWYFWDETEQLGTDIPYPTEQEAIKGLEVYCKSIFGA